MIRAASEVAGFSYVLAPDVRGKVTVQTSGGIREEAVFAVLLPILEVHGFTAVRAGTLYKIVRIESARERAIPTFVGPPPEAAAPSDALVTQIVTVRFAPLADLATALRPLLSPRGRLVVHPEATLLIITDTASNTSRLLDVVRRADLKVGRGEPQVIAIRFADVAYLVSILNQVVAGGRLGRTDATAPPIIVADRRSNTLIVRAGHHQLGTIRALIEQLDVPPGRRVVVYDPEHRRARDLAAILDAIYGAGRTLLRSPPEGNSGR